MKNELFKRAGAFMLAFACVVSGINVNSSAEAAEAQEAEVKIESGSISIGNSYISREFKIENDKIGTSAVENKRINKTTVPQAGSEDFVINTILQEEDSGEEEIPEVAPTKKVQQEGWQVKITNGSNEEISASETAKLTDGNPLTYPNEYTKSGNPFTVTIDFGAEKTISSFSVDKRPGYKEQIYGINGTMGEFEVQVSKDGSAYTSVATGEFTEKAYKLHEGEGTDETTNQTAHLYNIGKTVYANLKDTYKTRYVRLIQKSCALGSAQEFTTAELNFYEDTYTGPDWTAQKSEVAKSMILSSQLKYDKAEQTDTKPGGKKLTISYEPYEHDGVTYTIAQVVVLEDKDFYMRSFLEIAADNMEKAQIDYIDTDRFVLPEDAQGVWGHPKEAQISSQWILPHELMLGQPVYVNGLFMGSEFPAADTRVDDNHTAQIRYYSGKTFKKLKEDGQLTTDDKFVTWQNVIGAAEGTDTSVVQTSFFQYIEEIATPTEFRKQYNSWYDNMMNITDDSVALSFNGTEKGLAQNGIEPLDSYVMDDGWNNYYDGTYTAAPGNTQGTTPNQTGFWEFNAKFPNELYTSSELADKLQASFGLWLGPQGGYNYFTGFGQLMEARGTGYLQNDYWANICVGSETYVTNLEKLFIDYQQRFNIDYWKWDGFALRPCTNSSHDHMTGGDNNMYYTTDLWEKWTDLFDAVRASRAKENKGLFINATCYVNLSPWLLQWVNTIWVQDSGDTGELSTGGLASAERHQRKIYYRDNVYYNLYKKNQIQFPVKNIYNHDPIYGVSDSSNATTEVFREFLFANAMRGTAFWELYFSPSIMDDAKWKVAADAITWAETNHEILKNAKYFGHAPAEGVYGYSCWNGEDGIVSFTNPLDSEQTYELDVTDVNGAVSTLKNVKGIQVHPYADKELTPVSYGDKIKVTLNPHETVIYQYGLEDDKAAEVTSAKMTGTNELTVKFSERVRLGEFTADGEELAAELKEDYRTVVLTSASAFTKDVKVSVKGVKDVLGNTYAGELDIPYYVDGVVALADRPGLLKDASSVNVGYDALSDVVWLTDINKQYEVDTKNVLAGNTDFTVGINVRTEKSGVDLLTSGDDVKLSINAEGFVEFTVKNATLTGKEEVTTVVEKAHGTFNTKDYVPTATKKTTVGKVNDGKPHSITAVREVNGMLKLYLDGTIIASQYDKQKLNEKLSGGKITIGDTGFVGDLGEARILNYAVGFDEVYAIDTEIKDILMSEREGWSASACTEEQADSGDANANAAIDGNMNSWWHTNYNNDGDDCTAQNKKHWIEIDFGEEETFDTFLYVGRGAGSNGSIKDYILETVDAAGNYTKIKEGTFSQETAENMVDLGQMYTASGIRLQIVTTMNGKDFGAAVEINVGRKDTSLSKQELDAQAAEIMKDAENFDPDAYTTVTAKAYQNIVEKIGMIVNASAVSWNKLETAYYAARDGLVSIAELTPVLAEAEAIKKAGQGENTEELWKAFEEAYAAAQAAAVNGITDEEVAEALTGLRGAIDGLSAVNPNPLPFEDVLNQPGYWYYNTVADVYRRGLMTGKSEKIFAPLENLARAQFAVILWRMEGEPEMTYESKFPDVPDGQFYTQAVLWAAENGIVTGYTSTNTFGPSDNITREQMAVMMHRYAKYKKYDVTKSQELDSFPDAGQVQPFATEAVKWCTAMEIITGDGGKLNPQGNTNRAVCATIISRFVNAYE